MNDYIHANDQRWPVSVLCKTLRVSETGYYKYKKNLGKPSRDDLLSAVIREIINESPFNDNYGVPRMQIALKNKGIYAGRKSIRRVMKMLGLIHERKRRPKGLTRATTEVQERENLIKQDFTADKPYTKLVTDITQIKCKDGTLYISPIMDCFNGEILAIQMRNNMMKELCIDTFEAARKRHPIRGAVLHSDRGSQYTSEPFREVLRKNGVRQSLSGVNHCYDNARMESFFATLKKEALYRMKTYNVAMSEVRSMIFRYIFTYYNTIRIYTSNPDGLPPTQYRLELPEEIISA